MKAEHPLAKAYKLAQILVLKKDPYFYPLFQAKKEYYLKKFKQPIAAHSKALYWLANLLLVSESKSKKREGDINRGR